MPLDTRIPLMSQAPQMPDFGAYTQQRLANTQNIMAMQAQAAQAQKQNAMRNAYAKAFNPETGQMDINALSRGLAEAGAGELIPEAQQSFYKAQGERTGAQKGQYEFAKAVSADLRNSLSGSQNPQQAM